MQPRWQEDKEAYRKYLEAVGAPKEDIQWKVFTMELSEDRWARRIPFVPREPTIHEVPSTPIDHAWILGATCGDVFSRLTYLERTFLYLLHYGFNVKEASRILGFGKSSAYRMLREIKIKIGFKVRQCGTCGRTIVPRSGGPEARHRPSELEESDCWECVGL